MSNLEHREHRDSQEVSMHMHIAEKSTVKQVYKSHHCVKYILGGFMLGKTLLQQKKKYLFECTSSYSFNTYVYIP